MIMCENYRDYIQQLESRGATGLNDFYYVPQSGAQDADFNGLAVSLVDPHAVPPNENETDEPLYGYVVYHGAGDNTYLWNGLEYTYDGFRWYRMDESAAKT